MKKGENMGFITAIAMIVAGILAAASFIIKKKPESEDLINKVVPFQGWFGLIIFFWGIFDVIRAILAIGIIDDFFIWWVTWTVTAGLEVLLGFLLGFNLINQYVLSRKAEAAEKGEQLRQKLATIQIPLGFAGIAMGIWNLIAYISFYA